MSPLLLIALGPVQDFIAAARRTGDLAAGSRLLVEVAQAVARAVQGAGGSLIFPADPNAASPNKILAHLTSADPAETASGAKEAALKLLRDRWCRAWNTNAGHLTPHLDTALAAAQIEGFLEFYAAWWPLEGSYPDARRNVERLLAGRKALRTFDPPPADPGRPKSPLDPSRDCVLRTHPVRHTVPNECLGSPLWLKSRETLDAISLLKRLSAEPGVPSTSEMALRTVLPDMRQREPAIIRQLEEIARATRGALDLGDLFFPERVEDEAGRLGLDVARVKELRTRALGSVGLREAPAYYAVLVADGDRMGKIIAAQQSVESHRGLSSALSQFARDAHGIINHFAGYLVYSGGDDVLALLPANAAIRCARRLREVFASMLSGFKSERAVPGLSAGIAIVHHLTPLQTALEHARSAERLAKGERDSLAVALRVRGGAPVEVSLRWNEVGAWEEWVEAFRGGLARGVPYELAALAREWPRVGWPDRDRGERRVRDEARRIFERKEGGAGRTPPGWVKDAHSLGKFASLLTIARFLSRFGARAVSE